MRFINLGMSVLYFQVKKGNLKDIFQKNEEGRRRQGPRRGEEERKKGGKERGEKQKKLTFCIFLNYWLREHFYFNGIYPY